MFVNEKRLDHNRIIDYLHLKKKMLLNPLSRTGRDVRNEKRSCDNIKTELINPKLFQKTTCEIYTSYKKLPKLKLGPTAMLFC